MNELKITYLYDLSHTILNEYLLKFEYPWEVLNGLKDEIIHIGNKLDLNEYILIKENVWVHKTAKVFDSVYLDGPLIICEGAEIRHSAYIRGSVVVGKNAVVGNSSEVKNSILFDNVQVPHFNYIGDSILGYKAHMGAGAVTSNLKSDKSLVVIHNGSTDIKTNLKKVGAFLGDFVEVGCNSVLNPGTVIGRGTTVYPLSMVRGTVPANSIYKKAGEIADKI